MNQNFISGLIEGEGSFKIEMPLDISYKFGNRVSPTFSLEMREENESMLLQCIEIVGVGHINYRRNMVAWRIYSLEDCRTLIDFIDKHPLYGPKNKAFQFWKEVVLIKEQRSLIKKDFDYISQNRLTMNLTSRAKVIC